MCLCASYMKVEQNMDQWFGTSLKGLEKLEYIQLISCVILHFLIFRNFGSSLAKSVFDAFLSHTH